MHERDGQAAWDGLSPGDQGGDRAVLVWALHPLRVFRVYHCCGDQWEARLLELRGILSSFEVSS